MHAHVTAYKNHLVIEALATKSIKDEAHLSIDNPTCFGQVIMNTAKNLGVSAEALELLKYLKRGRDSLGDINWFATTNGTNSAFSWIGGMQAIKDINEIETSRDYVVMGYVLIPNNVPQGAMEAIDND